MALTELMYWLWWNRVPGIGPTRFYKLRDHFGSMHEAWQAPPDEIKRVIGDKAFQGWRFTAENWNPENELLKAERSGYRIYCIDDRDYPDLLKKIADPPPVLYTQGSFQYGDDIAVGIVGTRNPTPAGAYHARELASELSCQGLTIVSGMARGIDSEAHQGALAANGRTIAVLGCGIDVVYPPENEELMGKIAAKGVVVSEFPLGTEPLAGNFPARNRIISGLSLGIVVVEAAQDSGSLITAGLAVEQGREVFAVPGNVGSDGSKGPHKLIRQGAKLVETCQDVLAELAIPQLSATELRHDDSEGKILDTAEVKIYAVLNREPQHIDQICRKSSLPTAQVSAFLVQLEIKGLVKRYPGQLYLRLR